MLPLTLYIIVLFLLVAIIFQDFRFRAVSWIILPVLFLAIVAIRIHEDGINNALTNTAINFALVSLQLIFTLGYFVLIHKMKVSDFTRRFIGWGDILFFIAVTPAFTFPVYLAYMVTGLLLTLAVYSTGRSLRRQTSAPLQIPLAGLFAFYTIVLQALLLVFPHAEYNINLLLTAVL